MSDPIAKALNIRTIVETVKDEQDQAVVPANQTVIEPDGEFDAATHNMLELIEKGKEALDEAILVAKASQTARSFEVAANFIKVMAEVNEKLVNVAIEKKKQQATKPPEGMVNGQFIGSTQSLLQHIKSKRGA